MVRAYRNAASLGGEKVSPESRIEIVSDFGAAFPELVFSLVSCMRACVRKVLSSIDARVGSVESVAKLQLLRGWDPSGWSVLRRRPVT